VNCPGEETVSAFAEGRLDAPAIAQVDAHVATCVACQDLFAVVLATGTHERSQTAGARCLSAELGAADAELRRGASIGRYTILALVGSGAMGRVYAAYDTELDRKIALKLLQPGAAPAPARAQARLLREAKALAKLSHPNVVAVHDAGTFEGRVFVAMHFVDGVTLKDWLAERPRSHRKILDVFTGAARGLAAAHAAGLVHRDFKPTNVLIARDGSVRVADFGLARSVTDAAEARAGAVGARHAPHDPSLTGTRDLLGTPLYMAPEQFLLRPADARSDQFSFCVALYEALYGALPFGSDTLESVAVRVIDGAIEEPPPSAAVPAWLRQVLLRGLSTDPAARWASMDELVAMLGPAPARTGRRAAFAVAALLVAGVSALAIVRARSVPLCTAGPARLAGVWESGDTPGDRPKRAAVEKAFMATSASDACDTWRRVSTLLDDYRRRWLGMYREACEDTHVRHVQTAGLLDLRMACLDERRLALGSLVKVLASADRDVVEGAARAANALPTLDRCANRAQLEASVEPPRDEATRKRVDELRERVAVANAHHDTGQDDKCMSELRALVEEARQLGYRPLLGEVLALQAKISTFVRVEPGDAALSEEALWTTLASGREDLAAEMATYLVFNVGYVQALPAAAWRWSKLAHALIDRLGPGHDILRAWLLTDDAMITVRNDPSGTLPLFFESYEIKKRILPPDDQDLARSEMDIAESLHDLGRNEEALAMISLAHDKFARAFGPSSMETAVTDSNRGEYLAALGRHDEAIVNLRRALARFETDYGPEHFRLAFILTPLGRALVATGRTTEAIRVLSRALRLREAGEPDPRLVAETRFELARAELADGGAPERARALASGALREYVRAGDDKHAVEVAAWLGAQREGKR
jgi:tetratricopeptide (TPR) repeat protein